MLPAEERKRRILVVGNDTLVESPLVIRHLRDSLELIDKGADEAGLPLEVQITEPCIDQTFWVNVIGRGYIPPTRNFRWCTDRMKILPTSRLLERITRDAKGAVLLVGTRRAESQNRRRAMDRRSVSAVRMNRHSSVDGCRMFAPLADVDDQDVWITLMQRKPPVGRDPSPPNYALSQRRWRGVPTCDDEGASAVVWNLVAPFRVLDLHRRPERSQSPWIDRLWPP